MASWPIIHDLVPPDYASSELIAEAEIINQEIEALRSRQAQHNQAISRILDSDPLEVDEQAIVEAGQANAKLIGLLQAEVAVRQRCVDFWERASSEWETVAERVNSDYKATVAAALEQLRQAGFGLAVDDRNDLGAAAGKVAQSQEKCLGLQQQRDHLRRGRPTDSLVQVRHNLLQAKERLSQNLRSIAGVS